MIYQKIPLATDTTDQLVEVTLSGNAYRLRVLWNERFGYWSLSLSDVTGAPIITNIKMVTMFDLTSYYKDPRMPLGALYFAREKGPVKRPDYKDLNRTHFLWYVGPDPVVTAQPVYGQPSVVA